MTPANPVPMRLIKTPFDTPIKTANVVIVEIKPVKPIKVIQIDLTEGESFPLCEYLRLDEEHEIVWSQDPRGDVILFYYALVDVEISKRTHPEEPIMVAPQPILEALK